MISAVRISLEELENDNLGSEFLQFSKGRLYEKNQNTPFYRLLIFDIAGHIKDVFPVICKLLFIFNCSSTA